MQDNNTCPKCHVAFRVHDYKPTGMMGRFDLACPKFVYKQSPNGRTIKVHTNHA